MEEKNDLKFLQGFTKVRISKACKYFGFNQSNLMNGKSGRLAEKKVRNYIEQELAKVRLNETIDVVGEIECQEKSSTIQ